MSTSINVLVKMAPEGASQFATRPLDEAVWDRWVAKGKAQERRSKAAFLCAVKLVSIVALVVVAALLLRPAPYGTLLRFAITAGAMVAMFQVIRTARQQRTVPNV